MIEEAMLRKRRRASRQLSPEERMERFARLQADAMAMMSEEGRRHFHRRNHQKRRVDYQNGKWSSDRDLQSP